MIKKVIYSVLMFSLLFVMDGKAIDDKKEIRKIHRSAELYFFDENYEDALPLYLYLDSIGSGNANINFKIGYCYLNSGAFKILSIPYFEKAAANTSSEYVEYSYSEERAPQSTYSYLARAYHLDYEFDKAIFMFEKYKGLLGTNPMFEDEVADINHDIETCNNGKSMVRDSMKYTLRNLTEKINSRYAEFSPVISLDEQMIIFTSKRPDSTGLGKDKKGKYSDDIYYSTLENFKWTEAKPIGSKINTKKNEASVNLSADGQQLIVYKGEVGGGDLYVSSMGEKGWETPKLMDVNINTPYWETHACFSADNKIIYFISDRPGGYGGRDIYKCLRLPNGKWGPAQNLGADINTMYDEDGVFIHPNGKEIFFASRGHNSMGGFDIFSSKLDDENGFWSEPENMGYPINSPDDDIYFVVSTDGKHGYFTSAKETGYGEKDLYMIDFRENMPEALTLLRGVVTLNGAAPSGKLPSVQIIARDIKTDTILQIVKPVASTGKYVLLLASGLHGKSYSIRCTAKGYDPIDFVMTVPPDSSYYEIERSLNLQFVNFDSKPLDTILMSYDGPKKLIAINGKDSINTNGELVYEPFEVVTIPGETPGVESSIIKLPYFLFGINKYSIQDKYASQLEELTVLLKNHPELKIEVRGHTDSTGRESQNVKLSKNRAKKIVKLLVANGISKNRFVVKGYGSSVPVAPNTNPDGKPNVEGMNKNRRVDLRIVKVN